MTRRRPTDPGDARRRIVREVHPWAGLPPVDEVAAAIDAHLSGDPVQVALADAWGACQPLPSPDSNRIMREILTAVALLDNRATGA